MKVGLGVCARNEASTIVATLSSIVRSVSSGTELYNWQLVVCANGCTDGTVQAVSQWITDQADDRISLCEIDNSSLVEAQRIITARLIQNNADLLGFFDADILVAQDCIPRMLDEAKDRNVRAIYAASVPLSDGNETLIQRILNRYDLDSGVFSRRKHLHGRAFFVKEWNIPQVSPPLLADDIFISCDFLLRYGEHSIRQCPEAKVYFNQISSLEDVFQSYRRRRIELGKCLRLNPAFSGLPADQLNRQVVWSKLISEPPQAIALWLSFFALRLYCFVRFAAETITLRHYATWRPATSGKKPFTGHAGAQQDE